MIGKLDRNEKITIKSKAEDKTKTRFPKSLVI